MSISGTVVNGAVVLAEPLTVPDGTEVEIVVNSRMLSTSSRSINKPTDRDPWA